MSESHDKIIADKEAKIARLDEQMELGKKGLETIKASLVKAVESANACGTVFKSGAGLLEASIEISDVISRSAALVNEAGNKLLISMRETKAAFIAETNQLKSAAEDAKQFRYAASDLKSAVEIINSIRPTIRELMQNQDELNVIRNIIHACAPTIHRERSETSASEQAGPTPDVQER